MIGLPAADTRPFDEVHAAQRTFRLLLNALSRPGTLETLSDRMPDVPCGVDPHVALVAFTLLDQEVRFATSGPAPARLAGYIARRTGARQAPPEEAGFLFASGEDPDAPLARLPVGSPEFPEQGGTAVLTVERLSVKDDGDGPWSVMTLSGPGVAAMTQVHVRGLTGAVVDSFVDLNREYPLGIDALLIDLDGRVIGLPRTVRIVWDGR